MNPPNTALNFTYITYYKESLVWIVNWILVPVLIAVAFIVFLYGAFKYFIWGAGDVKNRAEGQTVMLYGVIGFVIIFSLWGIVNIFTTTLNLTGSHSPTPPTIETGASAPAGNAVSLPSAGRPKQGSGGILPGSSSVGGGQTSSGNSSNDACSFGPDGTDCTINGKPGRCTSGVCEPSRPSSNPSANSQCQESGPGVGCTTSSGVAGICNSNLVCQPSSGGSNDACSFGGDGTDCTVNGKPGTCTSGVCEPYYAP